MPNNTRQGHFAGKPCTSNPSLKSSPTSRKRVCRKLPRSMIHPRLYLGDLDKEKALRTGGQIAEGDAGKHEGEGETKLTVAKFTLVILLYVTVYIGRNCCGRQVCSMEIFKLINQ